MKKSLSLTIAIPAYNEAASLPNIIDQCASVAPLYARSWEILVVNDGSTDNSKTILTTLTKTHPNLRVITHPKNQGFSGAIKSCYRSAKNEVLFLLPADGQVDIHDLRIFWNALPHADVIVGYRTNNPEPFNRQLNSHVFHALYRMLFGVKLREISTSILWRRSALEKIDITAAPRSALIEPEVIYKAWTSGARFAEVPIPYYPRLSGSPKGSNPLMILMTLKEILRLWWHVRIAHAAAPNKIHQ